MRRLQTHDVVAHEINCYRFQMSYHESDQPAKGPSCCWDIVRIGLSVYWPTGVFHMLSTPGVLDLWSAYSDLGHAVTSGTSQSVGMQCEDDWTVAVQQLNSACCMLCLIQYTGIHRTLVEGCVLIRSTFLSCHILSHRVMSAGSRHLLTAGFLTIPRDRYVYVKEWQGAPLKGNTCPRLKGHMHEKIHLFFFVQFSREELNKKYFQYTSSKNYLLWKRYLDE